MSVLIQPLAAVLALGMIALARLWLRDWGQSRRRLIPITLAYVVLSGLCMPFVGHLAMGSLEWQFGPATRPPEGSEVIVVLAGGLSPPDFPGGRVQPDASTLARCLHGLELYRLGGRRPLLVSGGPADIGEDATPCSRVMREFLESCGVAPADLIEEGLSRTTAENASGCARILRRLGANRIFLITSASHMARARAAFLAHGIDVVPAPCQRRATHFEWTIRSFIPRPSAALAIQQALHEWAGLAWYRLKGQA